MYEIIADDIEPGMIIDTEQYGVLVVDDRLRGIHMIAVYTPANDMFRLYNNTLVRVIDPTEF